MPAVHTKTRGIMKYTFDKVTRLVIAALVIAAIILLVNRLSGVLLPFLIGWLIAYMMYPLVCFIQNKMRVRSRGLSIAIAVVAVAGVLTGLVMALVPAIGAEVSKAASLMTKYAQGRGGAGLPPVVADYVRELASRTDLREWLNIERIGELLKKLLPQVWTLLSGTWRAIAAIFVVFMVFLYTIFILLDYNAITLGFRRMIPPKYSAFLNGLIDDMERGMNRYFRGQALVAAIVGVMFAIGFSIIGLPLGITVGLFIGMLNLVPYLQTVGIIPVVLLAALQAAETGRSFWVIIALCAVVLIVVQCVEDMVLVPKIMGKAMGLNPAIILLSLSVWGSLMGMVGMIIALPVTTLMISYYKRFILKEAAGEPFPASVPDAVPPTHGETPSDGNGDS